MPALPAATLEDRAGTGHGAEAEAALRATLDRFAAAGRPVRRPVRAALEPLGVPGFAETQPGARRGLGEHVLHLQAGAAGAPWFPGLLAREVAHAVRSDEGHPSHDPALLQASFAAARGRSRDVRFLGTVGALNHHVRDLYAEDLAAEVAPDALAAFLAHAAALAAAAQGSAGDRAVARAYAAAAHARRGLTHPGPLREALAADVAAQALAADLAALPPTPELEGLEAAVAALVARLPEG